MCCLLLLVRSTVVTGEDRGPPPPGILYILQSMLLLLVLDVPGMWNLHNLCFLDMFLTATWIDAFSPLVFYLLVPVVFHEFMCGVLSCTGGSRTDGLRGRYYAGAFVCVIIARGGGTCPPLQQHTLTYVCVCAREEWGFSPQQLTPIGGMTVGRESLCCSSFGEQNGRPEIGI